MNIVVTQQVVSEIVDANILNAEIKQFLNTLIDKELSKREFMDTELVDECVALLAEPELIPIAPYDRENILHFCHQKTADSRKKHRRAVAVAVIAAIVSVTMLSAHPVLATHMKSILDEITMFTISAVKGSEDGGETVSIYMLLPNDFNTVVHSEEDISLNGVRIMAVNADGSETSIPLEDCEVTRQRLNSGDGDKIMLIISYHGCATSIIFTEVSL